MSSEFILLGLIWYIAFLLSITCHEAAHALAGLVQGDRTAEDQVTLNPIPHVLREPLGTVLAPLVFYASSGFMLGWASAPYDPYWRMRYPKKGALVALAGPAANFVLAILAGIGIRIGLMLGFFQRAMITPESLVGGTGAAEGLAIFLSVLFTLNVALGVFNLIPLPPLDGFGALGLVVPEATANQLEEWRQNPMFRLIGMLAAWQLSRYVIEPAWVASVHLLFPESRFG
jgi:Zn-dependent protease